MDREYVMVKGRVSVLMPVLHDKGEVFLRAAQSVLNQTHKDLELIIIIDNSLNEDAVMVASELSRKDGRVVVIKNDKRESGLAYSRNSAARIATGEFFAAMDADDYSYPNRLEKELEYLQDTGVDVVFSYVRFVDGNGESVGQHTPNKTKDLRASFLRKLYFVHPTALMKMELLRREPYDETFMRSQDLELWTRLYRKGYSFGIVPEILLDYTVHSNKESHEARLKRQIGYATYSRRVAKKHAALLVSSPQFILFTLRTLAYSLVLALPRKVLTLILRVKDRLK